MRKYVIRRLLMSIPTLIFVTVGLFLLLRLIPGDAAAATLLRFNQQATASEIAALRAELGLDQPMWQQYWNWIAGFFTGDLGTSLVTKRPVVDELKGRLVVTCELALLAIMLSFLISIPVGILSALRKDTIFDYLGRSLAIGALSVPTFWTATLVVVFPALWFQWSPPVSYSPLVDNPLANLQQFLPPAMLTAIALAAPQMRLMRSSLLDVINEDYIRTARAKGLSTYIVVIRHAIKNGMIPVLTIVGLQLSVAIGGTVIMEQIFGLPGLGSYLLAAINQRDYPVIQSINLLFASVIIFINICVDLGYAFLDPRIRYE
jgi:peptide/nickel transport system permease protein